jgi:hypothetical protein
MSPMIGTLAFKAKKKKNSKVTLNSGPLPLFSLPLINYKIKWNLKVYSFAYLQREKQYKWVEYSERITFNRAIALYLSKITDYSKNFIDGGGETRRMMEGMNLTMIYCKHFYKCHNVPPVQE